MLTSKRTESRHARDFCIACFRDGAGWASLARKLELTHEQNMAYRNMLTTRCLRVINLRKKVVPENTSNTDSCFNGFCILLDPPGLQCLAFFALTAHSYANHVSNYVSSDQPTLYPKP